MRTLEVPIEIEVYEGCTTATPVAMNRVRPAPRRAARRTVAPPARLAARAPRFAEIECDEALQFAGALPAEIVIE